MFVSLSSLFLIGLVFGSFISAVSYRLPRNIDFVKGRSFCDNCKKNLFWYDNIPLVSYIVFWGKSRCCGKKISSRYPVIEIATAIGFSVLYLFSFSPIYYLVYLISLTIFIIDYEFQIIPDELSWCILFLAIFFSPYPLFQSIFAGLIFSFAILLLNIITRGRGMGLGDVKLTLGLGAWLGLEKGLTWLTASFIIGGIVATLLLLFNKKSMNSKIAFGPFLIMAFWLILFL